MHYISVSSEAAGVYSFKNYNPDKYVFSNIKHFFKSCLEELDTSLEQHTLHFSAEVSILGLGDSNVDRERQGTSMTTYFSVQMTKNKNVLNRGHIYIQA